MNSIKLLLIDDNEDNRALIKIALEMATNWEIITASSGIEGINQAKLEIPDIILLDLIMPDLDGLTVHNLLKQNLFTCNIPIIFMTAMVSDQVLSELEDTDVNGIITKPLNPNTLASDISKMCDWRLFSDLKKNRLKNWNGCLD
ncbi:MAG: response regulator [Waterburya sp.]